MFFMLILQHKKILCAQKTVVSTKKTFHIEANVGQQNYMSHKKNRSNKKNYVTPKKDSCLLKCLVFQRKGICVYKKWFLLHINIC